LARIRRWRCTTCGAEGGFSFFSESFAEAVIAAQRRGHLMRKPECADGKFEVKS
jgi:hypothetical protein